MRQPYRIESITLKDVGVFEHTHFDFPQIKKEENDSQKAEIHIFTGPNGCGKSTVLYALAAIFSDSATNTSLLYRRFRGNNGRVECSFMDERDVIDAGDDIFGGQSPMISNQIINRYRGITNKVSSPHEHKTPFAVFAYSGQRTHRDNFYLPAIENVKRSPFEDALSFDATVRPKVFAQWLVSNLMKSALAKSSGEESNGRQYDYARQKICTFIEDICGLNIEFRLESHSSQVSTLVNSEVIDFELLPDGLKSITGWIGDLALRLDSVAWEEQTDIFSQPIILFLDEVDIHLHPKWQRRILPAIQKLLPNAQVFVSTHSPFVVGSVEDAYVYRLPEPAKNLCRDPHIAEHIEAIDSAAGKSYQLILAEIFGVEEEFDVETEQQLIQFKELIKMYMQNPQDDRDLMTLATQLSDKGEELAALVSMQLRQMHRLLKNKKG